MMLGSKIHIRMIPSHKPKPIDACGYQLKDLDEFRLMMRRMKDLNQVLFGGLPTISSFSVLFAPLYPKMGDKGACNSYCIDLMVPVA